MILLIKQWCYITPTTSTFYKSHNILIFIQEKCITVGRKREKSVNEYCKRIYSDEVNSKNIELEGLLAGNIFKCQKYVWESCMAHEGESSKNCKQTYSLDVCCHIAITNIYVNLDTSIPFLALRQHQ